MIDVPENKVAVGIACHKATKRWHIIVRRPDGETVGSDFSFATEQEARDQLERDFAELRELGYSYESIQ